MPPGIVCGFKSERASWGLHERVTPHDHAGALVAFEAPHRAKTRCELPVVGFASIVRVPVGVVERGGDQLIDGRRGASRPDRSRLRSAHHDRGAPS
jgi:hypothetical protein